MNWFKTIFERFAAQNKISSNRSTDGQRDAKKSVYDLTMDGGLTQGESVAKVTGGANLVDGKQTWEHAETGKHDIEIMKRCCDAEIETFEKIGQEPAPHYFWRVAVLSTKAKNYQQEVEYLQKYVDIIRGCYSRRDMTLEDAVKNRFLSATTCDIFDRLPKAKARLARQNKTG